MFQATEGGRAILCRRRMDNRKNLTVLEDLDRLPAPPHLLEQAMAIGLELGDIDPLHTSMVVRMNDHRQALRFFRPFGTFPILASRLPISSHNPSAPSSNPSSLDGRFSQSAKARCSNISISRNDGNSLASERPCAASDSATHTPSSR